MQIEPVKIVSPSVKEAKTPILTRLRQSVLINKCSKNLAPLSSDTVDLTPQAKINLQADRILSRTKKFTIQDYHSLSKLEKSVLREAYPRCEVAARDSLQVGLKVKESLDKRYDEGKYVFCSIGTSPTGIGRVLEFMGVETKYLPISHLNWLSSVQDWKQYVDKFPAYEKFLDEQGLSPEKVATSDKKYLFYDYVQQGMSLIVFEEMMKNHFGLDLPNVRFSNFNFLCYSSCAKNIDPPQYAIDYVENYMNQPNMSEYGGVPHLDIKDIDKIDECRNFEQRQAKMFNFFIIDELNKTGLLVDNPANHQIAY